jgi:hypothetical protein
MSPSVNGISTDTRTALSLPTGPSNRSDAFPLFRRIEGGHVAQNRALRRISPISSREKPIAALTGRVTDCGTLRVSPWATRETTLPLSPGFLRSGYSNRSTR